MKYQFLCFIVLLSTQLTAQSPDSVAIKQVDSLILLSRDFTAKNDFDKALEVNSAAEKLALESSGMETAIYGRCCLNRGIILSYRGDYSSSEKCFLDSKLILEKSMGREHPDYAFSLHALATLYLGMGQYEKAEPLFLKSKEIREKTLGKKHPDYAKSLNNLAILYLDMGQYEKAGQFYIEAIDVWEITLGKEHYDYANGLNNLANLYHDLGQYEKAEPLHIEAKAIREKVLGREHPDYAQSLNNLASLYLDMGLYEKAELFFIEAIEIRAESLGRNHRDYASSLMGLANLYWHLVQFEKAESLFLECKAIREKALGTEHPDYAWTLNGLALLYWDMDQNEKAEPLHLEAKAIWEKVLGTEHPNYAASLNNLALLYLDMGQYKKAEQLNLEAKAIREQALGREHPDYTWSLINLTDIYELQDRYIDAEPLLVEVFNQTVNRFKTATSFLSEKELAKYIDKFKYLGNKLGLYIIFRERNNTEFGVLPSLFYDHTLFYKGFLQTAASRLNAPNMFPPESTEMNHQLKSYRRRLAEEYTKPIADRGNVAVLEEKANAVEKEMVKSVAGYAEAIRQVKWQEVQKALKADEAAIEFVNFQINFPRLSDSVMYAALLITSKSPQPIFIKLFEEKVLTNLVSGNKESQSSELVAEIYTRGAVPLNRKNDQEGLFDLCWKPLESLLTSVKKIYYSPAGMLNKINFDAIKVGMGAEGKGATLSDKYELVRLGSTRSIVVPDTARRRVLDEVVLFGGIQYSLDTTNLVKDSIHVEETLSSSGLSFEYAFKSMRAKGSDWNYLPGTVKEILEISKIVKRSKFSGTIYKGVGATEEKVMEIGRNKTSPRVLHFATHGFFFPNPEKKWNTGHQEEPVFKMSDHPMIRSGLILAGGNHAWKYGKPALEGKEDGILTAYEISQMNLSNTELVVLSACETGLGDIQGNEGVYGLQRAFKIAGAKYLIMSLWQVPDNQTSLLMTTFYKKWLEEKLTIPNAFHAAQKELRDNGLDPYHWAGFVLVE